MFEIKKIYVREILSTQIINLNPINDLPLTVSDTLVVNEAGTVTLTNSGSSTLLDNDSDIDLAAVEFIPNKGPVVDNKNLKRIIYDKAYKINYEKLNPVYESIKNASISQDRKNF